MGVILCITPKDVFLSKYSGHRLKKRILRSATADEIKEIQQKVMLQVESSFMTLSFRLEMRMKSSQCADKKLLKGN